MTLEACSRAFMAYLPNTKIPVELVCKYELGHTCSHVADGTIDGIKFRAQWHKNRKDGSGPIKSVILR